MKKSKARLKICSFSAAAILIAFVVINTLTGSQWILFYDRNISGMVVDAGTNQPIEGALVIGQWELAQFLSEGFGGYAKVSLVKTDKNGRFTIPWWVRLKPWKLHSRRMDIAPLLAVYKPGYRFHYFSYQSLMHPTSIDEPDDRISHNKGEVRVSLLSGTSDGERIKNYHDIHTVARFSDPYFSKYQRNEIYKALSVDIRHLRSEKIYEFDLGGF